MSPRNCARLTLGRLPLRLGLTGGRQREHKPLLEPGGGIDGRARRCGRRPGRLLALRRSLDTRAREHGRNVRRRDVPGRRPSAAARARRIELLRDSRGIGRHPGGRRRSLDLEARRFLRRDIVPARRAARGPHRATPRTAAYERYDWNSVLAEEPENRAVMPQVMDGTSYFPSRPEMERGLLMFADRTGLAVRYGCRWESTRRQGDDFVLSTTDGDYNASIVVFAVGVAEPWKPQVLDVDGVEQYGELRPVETYANRRVFIAGHHTPRSHTPTPPLP